MGQRNWYIALSLEAAACLLLMALLGWKSGEGGILASLTAFPFAQIGLGLRWLSLSGAVGNGLAIGIYVLLGLIPLIALGVLWRRGRLRRADALLAVLSALLFWVLYLMVNPGLLTAWLNLAAGGIVGRAVLGGAVYGVLAGWLVLRALEMARGAGAGRLLWGLGWLLGLLAAAFVAAAFAGGAAGAQAAVVSLRNGNLGSEGTLGPSYVFLILGQGVAALPYALDAMVALRARGLVLELERDRYSQAAVAAAEGLSRLCARALAVTVGANLTFQLLQLACARWLRSLNTQVSFPLLSMAFVLGALLLSRLIREGKQLKDDNDLFV